MWELKKIFGFPIYGELFEEIIPPNEDINEMAQDFQLVLFELLTLFDLSREDGNRVKITTWVRLARHSNSKLLVSLLFERGRGLTSMRVLIQRRTTLLMIVLIFYNVCTRHSRDWRQGERLLCIQQSGFQKSSLIPMPMRLGRVAYSQSAKWLLGKFWLWLQLLLHIC